MYKTGVIGGTFSAFHEGHKKYIETAFDFADKIIIFVSTDFYAENIKKKGYEIPPFTTRINKIKNYLYKNHFQRDYRILPLISDKELRQFLINEDITFVLSTPEYYRKFSSINKYRIKNNKESFLILVKERVKDLSSTEFFTAR